MGRIFVLGALVYDIVFEVPDWVAPNHAVHASALTLSPGGKALNQAVAAKRLGAADVRLVGCVGADIFGEQMLAALRREGVNTQHIAVHKSARSSIASIIVHDNLPGFVGAPDASRRLSEEQIRRALAQLRPGDILSVSFELPQPLVRLALRLARAAGASTVLNPAPFFTRDAFVVRYLHLVDVLIPNKAEAQLILGTDESASDSLARALLGQGVGTVVLTLGAAGSVMYTKDAVLKQEAFTLAAVDTTGASDAFVGAFCRCRALGWGLTRALEFASAAAGLACTQRGTMAALPHLKAVNALLAGA